MNFSLGPVVLKGLAYSDIVLIAINVLLLVFSRRIICFLRQTENDTGRRGLFRIGAFRLFNVLIILTILLWRSDLIPDNLQVYEKSLHVLLVVYAGLLLGQIAHYAILRRYGKRHSIDDQKVVSETYVSRMLEIVVSLFIFSVVLVWVVNILESVEMLHATGVLGFMGVVLALSQAAWMPDIISGLIILNSKLIEDGDIVSFDNEGVVYMIYKTRLFYTEILNLENNHRMVISNARLRSKNIHCLTKFASARGLREKLVFDIENDLPIKKVRACFESAYQRAVDERLTGVENQYPLEVRITDVGESRLRWAVYYYTKQIRQIRDTRQILRELIVEQAVTMGIPIACSKPTDVRLEAFDRVGLADSEPAETIA